MATNPTNPLADLGAVPVKPKEPLNPLADLGAVPVNVPTDNPLEDLGAVPVASAEPQTISQQLLAEQSDGDVTPEDINRIGQYYNLSPEQIKELNEVKSYFGGYPKHLDSPELSAKELGKGFAGTVGRSLLFNLPQFIYKKTQEDPKYRAAIDSLSEVAEGRLSPITRVAEIGASIGGAVKLGQAAAKVAKGAGTAAQAAKYYEPVTAVTGGAAAGLGASKEGQELADTAKSAALGGALFGGVYGAGKVASALYKGATKISDKIIGESVKEAEQNAPKIEKALDDIMEKERPQYQPVKDLLIEKPEIKTLQEFREAVPQERMAAMVGQDTIEKLTKDDDSLKAINEALSRPVKGQLDAGDILERLAYDKYRKLSDNVQELIGKNRTLSEVISESPEFASKTVDNAFKISKASQVFTDLKLRRDIPGYNALQKAVIFISDGKPVAKMFDDKLGLKGKLSIEKILDEGSVRLNRYTDFLQKPLKQIYDNANKIRAAGEDLDSIYNELDTGKISSEGAKLYKQFFKDILSKAKDMDISIQAMENYVPKLRKQFAEYRIAFNKEAESVAKEAGLDNLSDLTEESYKQLLANKRFNLVKNELESLSGAEIKDFDDFKYAFNQFEKRPNELKNALDTVATATKSRVGEIPDWALEKNVNNLAARWVQNTFRYAAVRETVQNLRVSATLADKAGQDHIAKYLRNLASDVLGKRRGTLNSLGRDFSDQLKYRMLKKADSTDSQIAKRIYAGVSELPDLLTKIQSQVYPNYLGLNPKSAIQNLTSFYLQNMPELGPVVGTRLALETIVDLAKLKSKGVNLHEMIINEGILPRQWTAEMVEALQSGIKTGPLRNMSKKALELNTNVAMALFTKSETIARATTMLMAKRVANYMMKNPEKQLLLLNRMSSGAYRKAVRDSLEKGDLEGASKAMNQYMQTTNMFNYDRLNMSDYGRFMGPLFSIFSKWPTATAGKLAHYYMQGRKAEGTARLATVLLMPYFGLQLADTLIEDKAGESDIYKKLVGSKGLSGWTQLDSLPSDFSVREGLLSTPIASATVDLADAIAEKRGAGTVSKWVNNTLRTFMPGAGTIRFIKEDLPLYFTGEKQDKTTYVPER